MEDSTAICIARILHLLNITPEAVQRIMGVSRYKAKRLLDGTAIIRVNDVFTFCRITGLTPNELLGEAERGEQA